MELVILGSFFLSTILFNKKKELFTQNGGKKIMVTPYRVAPSKTHGVGLIAIADIPKGTEILKDRQEVSGNYYSKEELKDINPEFIKLMSDYWCLSDDKKVFIPNNPHLLSPVNFINHSNNPNIKFNGSHFITLKEIKKGEEIFEDYNEVCDKNHILLN